jgi:hypothetical protein
MLEKQMNGVRLKTKRDRKDPETEYAESLYVATDGSYGFPAAAFKSAIVSAANDIEGIAMSKIRRNIWLCADCEEQREVSFEFEVSVGSGKKRKKENEETKMVSFKQTFQSQLVRIEGEPTMRMDTVRVGGMSKSADIRFRGSFPEWSAILHIRHSDVIQSKEVMNLLLRAGLTIGIGEGRPEKKVDMGWGRFSVDWDRVKELEAGNA